MFSASKKILTLHITDQKLQQTLGGLILLYATICAVRLIETVLKLEKNVYYRTLENIMLIFKKAIILTAPPLFPLSPGNPL